MRSCKPLMNAHLHLFRISGNQRGLAVKPWGQGSVMVDEKSDFKPKCLVFRGLPKESNIFHDISRDIPVGSTWFFRVYQKRGGYFTRGKTFTRIARITANERTSERRLTKGKEG